jgi:hypothetical protein
MLHLVRFRAPCASLLQGQRSSSGRLQQRAQCVRGIQGRRAYIIQQGGRDLPLPAFCFSLTLPQVCAYASAIAGSAVAASPASLQLQVVSMNISFVSTNAAAAAPQRLHCSRLRPIAGEIKSAAASMSSCFW